MKASQLFRIASVLLVLLVLFAIGHTLGLRRTKPEWHVEPLITSVREINFVIDGFNRTYWGFYVGFRFFVSLLLPFAAIVSWQLGGLPTDAVLLVRGIAWAVATCFAVVTILSWRYFFVIPIAFSSQLPLV